MHTLENKSFRAFRIHAKSPSDAFHAAVETLRIEDLTPGDVIVRVHYAAVNYKDALAGTGQAQILRKSPLNGGIDLAGTVVHSNVAGYQAGDAVFAQGSGLSERYDGGFAQYARLPAEILLPIPHTRTPLEMVTIGTAGFTAALCIHQMEKNGQRPEHGEILVTGASGGVGSMAIHLLSQRGYRCVASTRNEANSDYLRKLGAHRIIGLLEPASAPLHSQKWAGAIDNLGGDTLVRIVSEIKQRGNVVSVGLVQSQQVALTVMPFIIRGMNLLGVSSANCPPDVRRKVWGEYAQYWQAQALKDIVAGYIGLAELPQCFARLLAGEVRGRYVVCFDEEGLRARTS